MMWWREKYPKELWPAFEDFKVFVALIWEMLNLPPPTPVQRDICDYLQHGPVRSIIQAFRGVGKSWITSAFVVWVLLRDPQLNCLVVSANKERSDQFAIFTKRLIKEHPLLAHLMPHDHQRQSNLSFDVAPAEPDHAPSVKAVGIYGMITGSRGDLIVADDIEVPNNSDTQAARDKLFDRQKEFSAVLKPGGRIIFLGTPQTEDSLYNKLALSNYERRIWPAQFPTVNEHIHSDMAPFVTERLQSSPEKYGRTHWNGLGSPVDPKRFDEQDLMQRELSYGRAGYRMQYMLDTRLSDLERYPLHLSDLLVEDCDIDTAPEKMVWARGPTTIINDIPFAGLDGDKLYRPADYLRNVNSDTVKRYAYQGAVMAIDPSGRGPDESVACVVKQLNSQLFLVDMEAYNDGYAPATLKAFAEMAKRNKVNEIIIEENFGGGMFASLLLPVVRDTYPVAIEEVRHSIQKERRIADVLEPVMNSHRLIVCPKVLQWDYHSTAELSTEKVNQYRLTFQMTRLTRERGALVHDDRLDALSMGVQYWVDAMAKDQEKDIKANRNREVDVMIKSFMKSRSSDLGTLVDMGGSTVNRLKPLSFI